MPAKSGKGGKQLKQKYAVFVGSMVGPKTKATMTKVLSAGLTNAIEWTPEEYGTLINSKFRRIEGSKALGWTGICGFTAAYAYYLHGDQHYTPLWKPVKPEDKDGPGYNPSAHPRFLELGFTGPLAQKEIQAIIHQGYKI